ncbi:hypothetical protein B0H63DRAFT_425804 [Podospora didyma]|uniref:Histone-lysine N-methyltransferase EZH2 n=1 Tax=Podospora didyma TaxID=330526 RepID=A0AAE0P6D7_9PEZI|nr:hypothetical protein B0H63DRAFT_425804 [Podospora didyma]
MPSIFDPIDLTGDTSSDSAGEEVVVITTTLFENKVSDTVECRPISSVRLPRNQPTLPWNRLSQTRDYSTPPAEATAPTPAPAQENKSPHDALSAAATKRTPADSPEPNPPARRELTPTKFVESFEAAVEDASFRPSSSLSNLQHLTPQSSERPPQVHQTPKANGSNTLDWNVEKIAAKLTTFAEAIGPGHARLVEFMLEETEKKAPQARHLSIIDDFADMKSTAIDPNNSQPDSGAMTFKIKQHTGDFGKAKGQGRKVMCPVVCIKSDKAAVPGYRFHHVEIRKNVLTPNTMLNFVPHLRDVDPNSAEETMYSNWLLELEKMDSTCGFKTQDRLQKPARRERNEHAATLSMYLESWLQKLAIPGCTKSSLIRYMATQKENSHGITPQQKSNILDSYGDDMAPQALQAAALFTEAFDRVFNDSQKKPRVTLESILSLETDLENILENKRAKEMPVSQKPGDTDLISRLEHNLGSYWVLGCMICFSHDCEHGDFDKDNQKRTFSVEVTGGFEQALRDKWVAQIDAQRAAQSNGAFNMSIHQPCDKECYRTHDTGNPDSPVEPWTERESQVLETVFGSLGYSQTLKPYCFVAAVLNRKCWDVYRKFKDMNISLPDIAPTEVTKIKPVSWYDRKRKQLLGDWQDYTSAHEVSRAVLVDPCSHDGPCTAANECGCVVSYGRPVLCDRFCHCTAETCALKFTGCACHSSGKTCYQRQKEGKPCICVQLNRECDPALCVGCGARERADPENAYDEHLHSHGCQNVALQRGATRAVLLGKSQLDGCGYGLFAAEDIPADAFVMEYTGELISNDEGVRREARRGDVFSEHTSASYIFTLLEEEGIWVDAAIYGNLSRYINHASEFDRKACNITPVILYVNGEYRIKFNTLRDIKAGEELFFNYGDNFPNLTKKLLENENKDDNNAATSSQKEKRRQRRGPARKTTGDANGEDIDFPPLPKAKRGKARKVAPDPAADSADEDLFDTAIIPLEDDDDEMADDWEEPTPKRRKKRGGRRPGAGRKKKQPVVSNPDGMDLDAPHDEISDSQEGGDSPDKGDDTPTRHRHPYYRSSTHLSELDPEASPGAATQNLLNRLRDVQLVKKPSKRGGARPGAGRKPKHPRPTPNGTPRKGDAKKGGHKGGSGASSNSSSASKANGSEANNAEDSDDAPLMETVRNRAEQPSGFRGSNGSFSTSGSGSFASGSGSGPEPVATGRKRKADEIAHDSEDRQDEDAGTIRAATNSTLVVAIAGGSGSGPYRQDHFQPIMDYASASGGGSASGDFDDDESITDRSARKRQKPLRYRFDEES